MNLSLTAFGETKTLVEWSTDARCVVPLHTLRYRIKANWEAERSLSEICHAKRKSSTKICKICNEPKPKTEEFFHHGGSNSWKSSCKGCENKRLRLTRNSSKDRAVNIKSKYGLTPEAYQAMHDLQNGLLNQKQESLGGLYVSYLLIMTTTAVRGQNPVAIALGDYYAVNAIFD